MSTTASTNFAPAPVVALAGWLVPGAGYWMLRDRSRALMVGVPVVVLFIMGCLLGSVRVVEAPSGSGTLTAVIAARPWFVPQVLNGPISLAAAWESSRLASDPTFADAVPHSRMADIPTLYTAIAGMLNLLAIIDSSFKAAAAQNPGDA